MSNQHNPDLTTYLLLNRLLKFKKLKYKLFTLAFVATHIPLISYIVYIFLSKQHNWSVTELLIILIATLVGTGFVLWSIHHLLKPLNYSARALDRYLKDATIMSLPHHINDEMGQLMRSIGYTLHSLDRRFKDLENVSSYDFLTDLHNRRSAKAKLSHLATAKENQSHHCFIIMIDLDDFKAINDRFGHFAGDVILKDVADEIKACFTTPDDWAARWGGDEFLLILYGSQQAILNQLKTMQNNIDQKQIPFEDQTMDYSVSVGITAFDKNKPLSELLQQADNGLLKAKNKGKNQIHQI